MTKAEKLKAYRIFVNITLAAHAIVEATESYCGAQRSTEEAECLKERKRLLKVAQNELAKDDCSIHKVEALFIEMVNHEE